MSSIAGRSYDSSKPLCSRKSSRRIAPQPLQNVLASRRHVKAYVHGHIHFRSLAKHRDIHIVNTPATSYVANTDTSTTGWTMARLSADRMTITTHTHLPDHPWNRKQDVLDWRA